MADSGTAHKAAAVSDGKTIIILAPVEDDIARMEGKVLHALRREMLEWQGQNKLRQLQSQRRQYATPVNITCGRH